MHICEYCGREFTTCYQKNGHESICPMNPASAARQKKMIDASRKAIREKSKNDPLNEVKTYDLICSRCGKHYSLDIRVRDFNRGNYKKTCSEFCAHQRDRTTKVKERIANGLKNAMKTERLHKCPKCGKEFLALGYGLKWCDECHYNYDGQKQKQIPTNTNKSKSVKASTSTIKKEKESKYSIGLHKVNHNIGLHKVICEVCGKEVYAEDDRCIHCWECATNLNEYRFRIFTAEGKRYFSEEYRKHLSERAKQLMKEGKIKPWLSRNITSYSERFFMKILDFNKIPYEREKRVERLLLGLLH